MAPIKTYVFFDLETTDLIKGTNFPGITELSMLAVKQKHFLDTKADEELRVQSKFRMCINPRKAMSKKAVQLSGLTNELLEMEAEFDTEAFRAISSFINCLQKPVCLIAHNGFDFHYPVVKYYIKKISAQLSPDIMCTDSLYAFYDLLEAEIHGQVEEVYEEAFDKRVEEKNFMDLKREFFFSPNMAPSDSYQLKDIYHRVVVEEHLQGNRAENHSTMMLKIAKSRPERFCNWVAENHCRLCQVPVNQ